MPRGRPRKNAQHKNAQRKNAQQDDVLMKSAELIGWALGGLEREILTTRERLSALTTQAGKLRTRLGREAGAAITSVTDAVTGSEPAAGARKRKRRKMSPEARKRISEMMKKRWAERRKSK